MQNFAINKEKQMATIGLFIAMASILMLFGTFVSSFYVLKIRLSSPLILPTSILIIGWVNTFILGFSSVSFTFCAKKHRSNDKNGFDFWMTVTIVFAMLFLLGQFFLWSELTELGIPVTQGQLSDMFYLISGVHGIHIISGLIALIWLQLSDFKLLDNNRVHHVGMFWHFLGLLWVVLFSVILF